jgi:hypothetical protein
MVSISTLVHINNVDIYGNKNGKVTVVITARHKAINVFPHIKRVNAIDAIHAGAIARRNTHVAISVDIYDIQKYNIKGNQIIITP